MQAATETHVPHILFLIFTVAVVVGILIQAGVFLGIFFVGRRTILKTEAIITDLSNKTIPILNRVHTLLEDLTPKIQVIAENVAETSTTVRHQVQHVNVTVDEVVDKSRAQVERADEMVSAVLDTIVHATNSVQSGISRPARQIHGVVNGLRAGLGSFFSRGNGNSHTARVAEDNIFEPEFVEEPYLSRRTNPRVESDEL